MEWRVVDAPEMKVCKCENCNTVLGHSDGARLQIANVLFYAKTRMFCLSCGTLWRWFPANPIYRVMNAAPPIALATNPVV